VSLGLQVAFPGATLDIHDPRLSIPLHHSPHPRSLLLDYAACNWGTYAKRQSNEAVMKLAQTLPGSGSTRSSASLQVIYGSIVTTGDWRVKYKLDHGEEANSVDPYFLASMYQLALD